MPAIAAMHWLVVLGHSRCCKHECHMYAACSGGQWTGLLITCSELGIPFNTVTLSSANHEACFGFRNNQPICYLIVLSLSRLLVYESIVIYLDLSFCFSYNMMEIICRVMPAWHICFCWKCWRIGAELNAASGPLGEAWFWGWQPHIAEYMILKLTIVAEWKMLWKLQTECCNNECYLVAWKRFDMAADITRCRLVWLGRVTRMGETREAKNIFF
jgi:hypothetical protein